MDNDPIVAVLPVHISNSLIPNLHLHQFPLLYRSLQAPPSAAESGKQIRARYKSRTNRFEIHVPVDTRKEVWNPEKGMEYGAARTEEDMLAAGIEKKAKQKDEEETRLNEVRLISEQITQRGEYMLGIVRDGHLHLHPFSQTHQFRPALTYLDILSQKSRRSRTGLGGEGDSESDDGPPPDPDDLPSIHPAAKKERQRSESKEVQVTARKTSEDKSGHQQFQGGMSQTRRDMLILLRNETEESWQDLMFRDREHPDFTEHFEEIFSEDFSNLVCKTGSTDMLCNLAS